MLLVLCAVILLGEIDLGAAEAPAADPAGTRR